MSHQSKMSDFETISLNEAKRYNLLENEIETYMTQKISIQDKSGSFEGKAHLTTHRFILINIHKAKSLSLAHIKSIEKKKSFFSNAKLLINLIDDSQIHVSLSELDKFIDSLDTQLKRKSWVEKPKEPQKVVFSTQTAGIGGLVKTMRKEEAKQTDTLKKAFTDIDSLMEHAKELIALSEKLSVTEAQDFLVTMGISSPVTKQITGTSFHTELAKQLAEFLPKHLVSGMITLTDAYCIYNRARGTDLVSPEDLYKSCVMLNKMNLPIQLKEFESGVKIIVKRDETISQTVLDIISEKEFVSSVGLANKLGVSMILTKEHLLMMEGKGILCRDETAEDVRFYKNFFFSY